MSNACGTNFSKKDLIGPSARRAYTPGLPGCAQPLPKLVAPTSRSSPSVSGASSGPPESPWQVSVPPCGYPAQTIVCGSNEPSSGKVLSPFGYAEAQYASVVIGTCA